MTDLEQIIAWATERAYERGHKDASNFAGRAVIWVGTADIRRTALRKIEKLGYKKLTDSECLILVNHELDRRKGLL